MRVTDLRLTAAVLICVACLQTSLSAIADDFTAVNDLLKQWKDFDFQGNELRSCSDSAIANCGKGIHDRSAKYLRELRSHLNITIANWNNEMKNCPDQCKLPSADTIIKIIKLHLNDIDDSEVQTVRISIKYILQHFLHEDRNNPAQYAVVVFLRYLLLIMKTLFEMPSLSFLSKEKQRFINLECSPESDDDAVELLQLEITARSLERNAVGPSDSQLLFMTMLRHSYPDITAEELCRPENKPSLDVHLQKISRTKLSNLFNYIVDYVHLEKRQLMLNNIATFAATELDFNIFEVFLNSKNDHDDHYPALWDIAVDFWKQQTLSDDDGLDKQSRIRKALFVTEIAKLALDKRALALSKSELALGGSRHALDKSVIMTNFFHKFVALIVGAIEQVPIDWLRTESGIEGEKLYSLLKEVFSADVNPPINTSTMKTINQLLIRQLSDRLLFWLSN